MPNKPQETPAAEPQASGAAAADAPPDPRPPVDVFYCQGSGSTVLILVIRLLLIVSFPLFSNSVYVPAGILRIRIPHHEM